MATIRSIKYLPLLILFLSGCAGFRFLEEDEKLLYKQKINAGNAFSDYVYEDRFIQTANVKFPPYAILFQWGKNYYDSSEYAEKRVDIRKKYEKKIESTDKERKKERLRSKMLRKTDRYDTKIKQGNLLMQWGEPLAIFDSSKISRNAENIRQFLFNEGYFQNSVSTKIQYKGLGKRKDKKVVVNYKIKEGPAYLIDTIYRKSADSLLLNLLEENNGESKLQKGERYRQDNFAKERERIEFYLKNRGYYNFSRQYVQYQIDTSLSKEPNRVAILLFIKEPREGKHQQYIIDSVNFIIRPPSQLAMKEEPVTYFSDGTKFYFYEDIFRTRTLNRRIFIQPDSLYSRDKTLKTQRQIANLDNFKFINVNYDSTGSHFIANIFTSPLDRYQWSHEVGLNVTQGLPGPFYNLSFKKRNVFKGMELFEINGRFGIEGVAAPGSEANFYRNREVGGNMTLTFPHFLFPGSESIKDRIGEVNPTTKLQAGYTDIDRFDYRRTNLNFNNTYSWQTEDNTFFNFSIFDLSIINTPRLSPSFEADLQELNSRIINTFEPSFVSNFNFSIYQTRIADDLSTATRTRFYKIYLESGGTFLNFGTPQILENTNLELYKYIKTELDFSQAKPLSAVSSIAYRINGGVAYPYSDNNALPYEKYFFAGGSNGVRAWRPRRLGPGSFTPINPETNQVDYRLEQQGELLLQASMEFRRDLFGFIDYALFLDAGNIWLLTDDPNREGENFELDRFYKEIAVGTGLGLRFDFSFLIMRFDVGIKTYDPARPLGSRFILSDGFFSGPFSNISQSELFVFNIGVGYPY